MALSTGAKIGISVGAGVLAIGSFLLLKKYFDSKAKKTMASVAPQDGTVNDNAAHAASMARLATMKVNPVKQTIQQHVNMGQLLDYNNS